MILSKEEIKVLQDKYCHPLYQKLSMEFSRAIERAVLAKAKGDNEKLIDILLRDVPGDHGASVVERLDALKQHWYLTAREDARRELSQQVNAVDEKCNERGEPEVIYLQLHNPDFFDSAERCNYRSDSVTWCWHAINQNDVRYVREDLAMPAPKQEPVDWNAQCSCGHRWVMDLPTENCPKCNPAPPQAAAIPEAHNIREINRGSDQSVTVVFASCRAASAFEKALSAAKDSE